jgi:hypothetical protein
LPQLEQLGGIMDGMEPISSQFALEIENIYLEKFEMVK